MTVKKIYETDGKLCGFNIISDNEEVQIGRSSIANTTFYIKKYIGYAEVINTAFYSHNWGQAYLFGKSNLTTN